MATRPPREVINAINRVLNSIRSAFDIGGIGRGRVDSDIEVIREAYLRIEDMRFSFRANTGRFRRDSESQDMAAFNELGESLRDFTEFDSFMSLAHALRYRAVPWPSSRSERPTFLHPALADSDISTGDAIHLLIESLGVIADRHPLETEEREIAYSTARLRNVLPRQKVSPVRFDIVENRIVIAPQPANATGLDAEVAHAARSELIDRGEKLIDELGRSNCDPRLLETVTALQNQLIDEADVVRLGIANLGCSMMCSAFERELPDAIGALMRSQSLGVSMYVAQFPEWTRFSENAAAAEIDEGAIRQIYETASGLVKSLEAKPSLADPEVPKIIAHLNSLIADPSGAPKRVAFAVLRTIENLVIRIYHYGADFFDQTIRKTSEALSTTTARVIAAGLLAIALASAAGLAPVAAVVEGSSWLSTASEIVARQLQLIGG